MCQRGRHKILLPYGTDNLTLPSILVKNESNNITIYTVKIFTRKVKLPIPYSDIEMVDCCNFISATLATCTAPNDILFWPKVYPTEQRCIYVTQLTYIHAKGKQSDSLLLRILIFSMCNLVVI